MLNGGYEHDDETEAKDVIHAATNRTMEQLHVANLMIPLVLNSVLGPALGLPLNPQAAAEAEKLVSSSLQKIESTWLEEKAKFLLGSLQPSIADLSLVCEIMQLELLDEKDRERILGPHSRILLWIENVKKATAPHFQEVHAILYKVKAKLHGVPQMRNDNGASIRKTSTRSKL
ncbi:Glutathione S-transferase theta-1 [Asimina triloba]